MKFLFIVCLVLVVRAADVPEDVETFFSDEEILALDGLEKPRARQDQMRFMTTLDFAECAYLNETDRVLQYLKEEKTLRYEKGFHIVPRGNDYAAFADLSSGAFFVMLAWPSAGFAAVELFGAQQKQQSTFRKIFNCSTHESRSGRQEMDSGYLGRLFAATKEAVTKNGLARALEVARRDALVLVNVETEYQDIRIVFKPNFGKALIIDEILQLSARDEFIYHEMMVRPALLGGAAPLCTPTSNVSVLIIGGGDGGTLREVLVHSCVKRVVMCELDRMVVFLTEQFLGINGNYSDPRVELRFGDGLKYAGSEAVTQDPFDLVLVDSTDPGEESKSSLLYSEPFYRLMSNALKPSGKLVAQMDVPYLTPNVFQNATHELRRVFPVVEVFAVAVPSFSAAEMAFGIASKSPTGFSNTTTTQNTGKFFTAGIHNASFALPPLWVKLLAKPRAKLRSPEILGHLYSVEANVAESFVPLRKPKIEAHFIASAFHGVLLNMGDSSLVSTHTGFYIHESLAYIPILGSSFSVKARQGGPGLRILVTFSAGAGLLYYLQALPYVAEIVLLDPNPAFLQAGLELLRFGTNMSDPRIKVVNMAPIDYLASADAAANQGQFDAILHDDHHDSLFPGNPDKLARILLEFKSLLKLNGVFTFSVGTPFWYRSAKNPLYLLATAVRSAGFKFQIFNINHPLRQGYLAFMILSLDGVDRSVPLSPCPMQDQLLYYTPQLHTARFSLPFYWSQLIAGQMPVTLKRADGKMPHLREKRQGAHSDVDKGEDEFDNDSDN